jgi:hypothetical protein
VLAAAAAVTPARAWVIDALRSILGAAGSEPQQTTGSLVSFVPTGQEFRVDFLQRQTAGTLRVYVETTTAASARTIGREAGEGFVVHSSGLTIRNSNESSVSYELRLPGSCETLVVRIAGVTVGRYQIRSPVGTRGPPLEVDLTETDPSG